MSQNETQNPNPSNASDADETDGKSSSSSPNRYIWVNPRSSRGSHFRKRSYDSRYASLAKVAEDLNLCSAVEEDVCKILDSLGDKMIERDAVIVLNNMTNPDTALLALMLFQKKLTLSKELILFNVTLKVFIKCKNLDMAEKLFDELLQRGVVPDNITFSTIISCARLSSLPNKAIEWFEKMPGFGCEPDEITYAVMIDAYGKAGNVDMALSLYDRAKTEKWRIDAVTFATVFKVFALLGNFDGSRDRKNRERRDIDFVQEERSSKYSAVHLVETELSDKRRFSDILLSFPPSFCKKPLHSGKVSSCVLAEVTIVTLNPRICSKISK